MSTRKYEVDPSQSCLYIFTYKAGLLSPLGHDLRLLAPKYTCTLEATPGGQQVLTVSVDAREIIVDGQVTMIDDHRVVGPLSDWACKATIANMQSEAVLNVDEYPSIVYRGVVQNREGNTSTIVGELQLRGIWRPLVLTSQVTANSDGSFRFAGEVEIHQSDWGIEPFSTLMGAMRIKDELHVAWSTRFIKAR